MKLSSDSYVRITAHGEVTWGSRSVPYWQANGTVFTPCRAVIFLWALAVAFGASLLEAQQTTRDNASLPPEKSATHPVEVDHGDRESPPKFTDYPAVIEALTAVIRDEVEQKQIPVFSFALVEGDRRAWAGGFGFQDAEKTIPATADTVYLLR